MYFSVEYTSDPRPFNWPDWHIYHIWRESWGIFLWGNELGYNYGFRAITPCSPFFFFFKKKRNYHVKLSSHSKTKWWSKVTRHEERKTCEGEKKKKKLKDRYMGHIINFVGAFFLVNKIIFVRGWIRTHALIGGPELKSGALDG